MTIVGFSNMLDTRVMSAQHGFMLTREVVTTHKPETPAGSTSRRSCLPATDWHSFLTSIRKHHDGAAGPVPPTGLNFKQADR